MCGEQPYLETNLHDIAGSSPSVRGADLHKLGPFVHKGIIPACAGSRSWVAINPAAARDHPRVCGEQVVKAEQSVGGKGSSPRVRGAAISTQSALVDHGIIPACAGSSPHTTIYLRFCWDHPRVCGEQLELQTGLQRYQGSSPRVRGAVVTMHFVKAPHGIIPACAGSSAGACTGLLTGRDHPRVCGEQRLKKSVIKTPSGSSPRVRGAVERELLTGQRLGIIPACAGSRRLKKVQ